MRVIGTAGHVDHGKSSLLRALTGMEPDRWEEEKRRGLTIDLGFVWTDLDTSEGQTTIAFVDVPGHERFIANMLAGAGAVPLALFVVAADDGWSAQSQEHLDILDLLDIPAVLVPITKADLVGPERAEEVAADVRRRLAGTSLEDAPTIVVDSLSGHGVDDVRTTLASRLPTLPVPRDRGRPRLWIDRAFTVAGAGTVVTGTLAGGRVTLGEEVVVLPTARRVRVRGLQALGQPVDVGEPGSRLAVNLAGIGHDEIARGDTVVADAAQWITARRPDAWLRALPGHEIGRQGAWHLHVGTAETVVDVRPLLGEPVPGGDAGPVRLLLHAPLALASGDRFVIRDAGRRATAGGGVILDPDPPGGVRGPDARLARSESLEAVSRADAPRDRLVALVRGRAGAAPAARARAAAGAGPDEPLAAGLVELGDHVVTEEAAERFERAVLDAAAAAHVREPTGPGADRSELVAAARAVGCPSALAPALVDDLSRRGGLVRRGSAYALAEHAGARDEARGRRQRALLERLDEDPFAPPALDEVAAEMGLRHEEVNDLVTRGEIVDCGAVAFSASAVEQAVARLAALADRSGGRFTTAEAREALGTTRKYAIPLLERLDALGVTDFDGQTRAVADPSRVRRASRT